jgi:hypothetical protein
MRTADDLRDSGPVPQSMLDAHRIRPEPSAFERLDVNRQQVINDRRSGMSLTQVAKKHAISRASVCRLMKDANDSQKPEAPVFAVSEQASAASGAAQ